MYMNTSRPEASTGESMWFRPTFKTGGVHPLAMESVLSSGFTEAVALTFPGAAVLVEWGRGVAFAMLLLVAMTVTVGTG